MALKDILKGFVFGGKPIESALDPVLQTGSPAQDRSNLESYNLQLQTDIAGAEFGTVRNPWSSSTGSVVTPARLGQLLRDSEQGNSEAFLEFAEHLEELDSHYRSVISTRKIQTSSLAITVEAASDDAQDQKIADFVRQVLDQSGTPAVIADMLDALAKGFSVLEIIWQTGKEWRPERIEWRDRRFAFDYGSPRD